MLDRTLGAAAARAARNSDARTSHPPMPPELILTYVMWALVLFEPEALVANLGAGPVKYLPTVLLPIAVVVAATKADRRAICWPVGLFVALHVVSLPFVTNRGYAMEPTKIILFQCVLLVLSAATIDRVEKMWPVVSMFLIQFAWWGLQGLPGGRVRWHFLFGNPDAFGPLMVVGVGFATFVILAARTKTLRTRAIVVAGIAGIGVIASVARGAAMAAALVVIVVWLRSPRKLAMSVGIVLVVGTMIVASYVLFPDGEFWGEMASISADIKALGGEVVEEECIRAASNRACGSATDRWDLWDAGWKVFQRSPLLGVGPGNFGAYAAENFAWGEANGFYADPGHLYGRQLHNIFVQILAEHGVIGAAVFLWILIDFVRRNRRLRTKAAREQWDAGTQKSTDLRSISLALEAAMVGFLASGYFYDLLYTNIFYSIIALNFGLWRVAAGHEHGYGSAQQRLAAVDRRELEGRLRIHRAK